MPLWLCGIGAFVAWMGGSISEYDAKQRHPQQQHDRTNSVTARLRPAVAESAASSPGTTGSSANPSEGAAGLAFAAAQTPGIGRLEAFQQALRGINTNNWQEVAEAAHRAYREGLIANMEESWIFQRIGEVAGPMAMKFFEPADIESGNVPRGGLSALRGWAAKDLEAAWAYVEGLPESHHRRMTTAGFIRTAVEKDLTLARQALDSMTPNAQADFFARELQGDVPGAYTRLAEDWLKEQPGQADATTGLAVQSSVFGNLVRLRLAKGGEYAGGEEMAGWLASYADKPYAINGAMQWAIRAQSRQDPARAISLVETLVPPDKPNSMPGGWNIVADGVAMLVASDPDAGLRWINERRDTPLYAPAVYALIAEQGPSMNDETVQTWLETVDETTRARIAQLRKRQKAGTNVSLSGQIRGKSGQPY